MTKVKTFFRQTVILLCGICMIIACGSDNGDDEKEETKDVPVTGILSFTLPNGITATNTSPAVVTQGQPLDMEISQKSCYTDPNGSIYTCEPKANIKLIVTQDTLYAKDLQTLISVTESSDVSESGTNPRRCQTLQKFNVGGQEIVFDLAHEIYTYVNSKQTSIEMPYIKVNPAKYGAATPKETRSSTPASVSGIRLKPLGAVTRGLTVTTSQAYEVNISFNVELEGVNTKETTTQTLSFEANYVGIVETSTILPDPTTSFSYQLEVLDGTSNTSSPFELQKGKTLSLQWNEDSRYSYFLPETLEEKTVSLEPKAWVKLAASQDTIWTDAKEALEKVMASEPVVTTEGTNPAATTGKWICDIGGQTLTLDYGYEAYADVTVQDTTLTMPYLKLELPEIKSVTLNYLDGVTIPDVASDVYEITVRITQELKTLNMASPSSETLEYVVKYIGVEMVKLVKVTYRKDWKWEYCDEEWIIWPIVYRDRTYSNGVTTTDTFAGYGNLCWYGCGYQPWGGGEATATSKNGILTWVITDYVFGNTYEYVDIDNPRNVDDSFKVYYSKAVSSLPHIYSVDTLVICNRRMGVQNLNELGPLEIMAPYYVSDSVLPGEWDKYKCSKSYEGMELDVLLEDVTVIGPDDVSSQPSGWYYSEHRYNWRNLWVNYGPVYFNIELRPIFYDQYLVIDGQMIHFLNEAFDEKKYGWEWKEESIVEGDGTPAKRYTFTGWTTFYGLKFTNIGIGTIYQMKPDEQAAPTATPKQQNRILSPLKPTQPVARQKTYAPKGQYRYGFISGGDIHGRGKGPRPFTAADDLRSITKRQGVKVEVK